MKTLSFEQMEQVEGGKNLAQCVGGVGAILSLCFFAMFAPAATAAAIMTGEGALLATQIIALGAEMISTGC
jgi:hypothetical protein